MLRTIKKLISRFKLSISIKQLIKEWAIYSFIKAFIFLGIIAILIGIIYIVKDYIMADKAFWISMAVIAFLLLNAFDVYVKLKLLNKQ